MTQNEWNRLPVLAVLDGEHVATHLEHPFFAHTVEGASFAILQHAHRVVVHGLSAEDGAAIYHRVVVTDAQGAVLWDTPMPAEPVVEPVASEVSA